MKIVNNDVIEEMVASGWFRVNNEGRIETCYQWRACKYHCDRPWFVCDRPDGKGYRYVSFKHRRVKAHRLAYALYTGESLGDLEINHLDGNRLNNRRENLELCNAQRQSKHAYDTGLNRGQGELHYRAKVTAAQVKEIRRLADLGVTYTRIAPQFGITATAVRYIHIRHTWKELK